MVHAQIECRKYSLSDHTAVTYGDESDDIQRYLTRGRLNRAYIGDLYAAMCCFGLCLPNVPHKPVSVAVQEVDKIETVERKVIKGCRVQFKRERSAELYDPNCNSRFTSIVDPYSGVISTRLTAAGAHFYVCDVKIPDTTNRMETAVRDVNRTYCLPKGDDPGGPVLAPFALDGQDRLYILDQDHINMPVLQYGDEICIDYTPDTVVPGIMVIDNSSGTPRKCTTRDLYQLPNPYNIYCSETFTFVSNHTRRIKGAPFNEPLGTQKGTEFSLQHLHLWLTAPTLILEAINGFRVGTSPVGGERAMETPSTQMYKEDAFNCGDKSMLGGPLPIKLMGGTYLDAPCDDTGAPFRENAEHQLAATARVAPLSYLEGSNYSASFDHDGPVDVDALASRMSRMGQRNVIGVAMQRIKTDSQGDLMLHDGV